MWRPQRSELGAQAAKTVQTTCIKRLLRDLKYIRENTIPTVGVAALPLERNLKVWHCNIRGPKGTPYEGGIFHMILDFPDSYPYDPPSVTVCTPLPHPNIVGTTICLDMLQPGDEQEQYIGWSSGYSVQSVLIQLQAFLFEQSPTIRPEDCRKAIETANNYHCTQCPHKPLRSWPELPQYKKNSFVLQKSQIDIIKEELVCFHSKRTYEDDTLGFGISFNKSIHTGELQNVSSPLDLIGIKAFMREGIRRSSLNEPFTHWLPIYINVEHGKRAIHLAKRALSMICTGHTKEFKPAMVLEVFPKLLNTMIVQIMKGQIHASIRALDGYCAFHRLFLEFLREYPELHQECITRVKNFVESEKNRHKDLTPSLGEFLIFLTVSGYKWKDIAEGFIKESLDREVYWLLNGYPKFSKEEADPVVDKERETVTFGSSLIGLRLIMFHMYFCEHVATIQTSDKDPKKLWMI